MLFYSINLQFKCFVLVLSRAIHKRSIMVRYTAQRWLNQRIRERQRHHRTHMHWHEWKAGYFRAEIHVGIGVYTNWRLWMALTIRRMQMSGSSVDEVCAAIPPKWLCWAIWHVCARHTNEFGHQSNEQISERHIEHQKTQMATGTTQQITPPALKRAAFVLRPTEIACFTPSHRKYAYSWVRMENRFTEHGN